MFIFFFLIKSYSIKLFNFPTFSFLCLTLLYTLSFYTTWIHPGKLYTSVYSLRIYTSPYFNTNYTYCELNASTLLCYSFSMHNLYTSMPVWFWYCTVNYYNACTVGCTVLCYPFSTPLYLFASTILVLHCELYACIVSGVEAYKV